MTKSYSKDIQLLVKIAMNQEKILKTLKHFKCNSENIVQNEMAFDLCSFYMSQIGEAARYLTDNSKESFKYLDINCAYYFRNRVDHAYEKINKLYIKSYIFNVVSKEAIKEVKDRIVYCKNNRR